MKKLIQLSALFLVLVLPFACNDSGKTADLAVASVQENAKPLPVPEASTSQVERKLIREGFLEFESKNIASTRSRVLSAVEKYKAYLAKDNSYKTSGRINHVMSIRIPADNFDAFLKDATAGVDKFDNKRISTKDVTMEFIDIQARLKAKKELEQRYLSLLKKAGSVEEILKIESEIGKLRSDIESIQGRLKYLKNRIAFSTLEISFYEKVPVQNEFGEEFGEGFVSGWDNFIWFFVVLTHVWPFILFGVLFFFLVRFWRKRREQKRLTNK